MRSIAGRHIDSSLFTEERRRNLVGNNQRIEYGTVSHVAKELPGRPISRIDADCKLNLGFSLDSYHTPYVSRGNISWDRAQFPIGIREGDRVAFILSNERPGYVQLWTTERLAKAAEQEARGQKRKIRARMLCDLFLHHTLTTQGQRPGIHQGARPMTKNEKRDLDRKLSHTS